MAQPTRVVTGKVRLMFPNLFKPVALREGQEPKYSVMVVIPKSEKDTLKKLRDAEAEALRQGIEQKWGGKKPRNLAPSIIKDADEDGTAEDYPDRANTYYLTTSAASRFKVGVVDRQKQEVMDESEVYSGAYARVSMTAFPYDAQGNRGVSFGLNNVQMLGGGERLIGGPSAEDEFDEWTEDDDGDDAESLV